MLRSQDIGTGLYGGGKYLAVWDMVDGYPRCVDAPLIMSAAPTSVVAATIAINRAVAAIAARAEAAEASAKLWAYDEPPQTVQAFGPNGDAVAVENPLHVRWVAAGEMLQSIKNDGPLQHLLRTRSGTLSADQNGVTEPGWVLALPPVPAISPTAQTADWDGHAWVIRSLTDEEAAIWPLKPPPTPCQVTRVQFRIALSQAGLLATVDQAVEASPNPEVKERWGASVIERDSPVLIAMAGQLGISPQAVDQVFAVAATL